MDRKTSNGRRNRDQPGRMARALAALILGLVLATCPPGRALGDQDFDQDGAPNGADNCPVHFNPDQADQDGDGIGDACDWDLDGDDVGNPADNCPAVYNPVQGDVDGDGLGDACDLDSDNDGVLDAADNCVHDWNPDQSDLDGDLSGDVCDEDDDEDGVPDDDDNCPATHNPQQQDFDLDGAGDACDADDDNDTIPDAADNCPLTPNVFQDDNDGDGMGDKCDDDDDNDGVPDVQDNCVHLVNPEQGDNDGDGVGDACDPDDDNDGVPDGEDDCPFTADYAQQDNDLDGLGDACDPDDDNDGVPDGEDNCPAIWNEAQEDNDGDGMGDACDPDDDNDLDPDLTDCAPLDPAISHSQAESANGIDDDCDGAVDEGFLDTDGDGVPDSIDPDDDNDGVPDGEDNCPLTPNVDQANTDLAAGGGDAGCLADALGDACDEDDDGDGIPDDEDNCPFVCNPIPTDRDAQEDLDADGIGDACDSDVDGDGLLNDEELAGSVIDPLDCPYQGDFQSMMEAGAWCTFLDLADSDGDGHGDGEEVHPAAWLSDWTTPTDPTWDQDRPFHHVPQRALPYGGCGVAVTAGAGAAMVCLVLPLILLGFRRRLRCACLVLGMLTLFGTPALGYDLNTLRPSGVARGGVFVDGTDALVAGKGGVQFAYAYLQRPLWLGAARKKPLEELDGSAYPDLIRREHLAHLLLAWGIAEGAEVVFSLPVTLDRDLGAPVGSLGTSGTHDLGVGLRYQILNPRRYAVGLLGSMELLLDNGAEEKLMGSGGVDIVMNLAADRRFGPVYTALNIGFRRYHESESLGVELEYLLTWGAVVAVSVVRDLLDLYVEFDQIYQVEAPHQFNTGLFLGGGRLALGPLDFSVAGGAGLTNGPGTPEFILVAGFGFFQAPDVLEKRVREALIKE